MAKLMKHSGVRWIGDIPKNWNVKRIKYLPNDEIDSFVDGDWIESPYITESGIRYLTSGNIGDGKFKRQGDGYITPQTFRLLKCKYAYPQDLVFCRLNAPFGRSCILPGDEKEYVIAVDNVILRTNEDKRYICYLTQTKEYQEHIALICNGMAMQRIARTKLGDIPLPIPELPEQKAIADFLDKKCAEIDGLLADLEAEVKTLAEYKKSIIAETLTRGLNPNAPMKQSGIPWAESIPAHWDIQKGKYTFRLLQRPVKEDDGVITCFRDGEVTLRSNRREDGFTMSAKEYGYQGIEPGDLVVHGMDGFAGSIGISDSRGKGTPVLNVLDSKYNKRYLMYYLRNMAYGDVFLALSTGIRVRSCDLGWKKLGEIRIVLPPIEEQEKIADYIDHKLDEIQNAIVNKTQQTETLKAYKSSLIYEYVTGKKQVI